MSLPDLAAILWRQREMLERLSYKLECEQLLLAAGRTRWLNAATTEVETALEELRLLDMQRAAASDVAAAEAGLPAGMSLEQLAAGVQPPWTALLLEHRDALLALTTELAAIAEANRHLMAAGLSAVETALANLGLPGAGAQAEAYDARGRTASLNRTLGGVGVVDRAL
ncbi:MAG: flagellar protein FlgN [Kineosporiaceae bacterium]